MTVRLKEGDTIQFEALGLLPQTGAYPDSGIRERLYLLVALLEINGSSLSEDVLLKVGIFSDTLPEEVRMRLFNGNSMGWRAPNDPVWVWESQLIKGRVLHSTAKNAEQKSVFRALFLDITSLRSIRKPVRDTVSYPMLYRHNITDIRVS